MNCNENMCVHGLYLRQPKCQMCVYLHESKKKNSECGPILNHEKRSGPVQHVSDRVVGSH